MTKKEKAISALMAVFPAAETFTVFSQNSDNAIILDSFINFAARNGIIKVAD